MSYLIIIGCYILALVIANYVCGPWIDSCNCDDSNQGRNCKNCTPPKLPRR